MQQVSEAGGRGGAGRALATSQGRRSCTAVAGSLAALVLGLVACACNPAPVSVAARRLVPIAGGEVRRIAVLPFTTSERLSRPGAGEAFVEPPAETVTRAVATAMRRQRDWQIVDDMVVVEAFRKLYGEVRAPTPPEAQAVGKLVAADAVLRGQVEEFEERIGAGFAAQRPARVVFAVELMAIPSGVAVWQAAYAETQRALSENLWNLFGFLRAGARWVRASELAALGADQVASSLHQDLYGSGRAPTRSAQ